MIVLATQNFPPDTGGIAALMGGLAAELAAQAPVQVFAHRIRSRGAAEWVDHPFALLRRFGGPPPWRHWWKSRALRAPLASAALRGVICDSWKSALQLPPTDAPVLVLAHGTEFPPAPSARRAARTRRGLARASVVVANSAYTAGLLMPHLAPDARVEVIPPPIAPQPAPSPEARAAIRAQAGAGPLLACVTRLEPRKGLDRVIAALPELAVAHPGVRLLLAGTGADQGRLAALAAARDVTERVLFLGHVDEGTKAALLAEADLFVMPVRREGASVEGFGIAYLEAAWHGCPALAGREGGAAEAVADGETGIVCDGADPSAVTAALAMLLADPVRRAAMGRAAAARVRAGFLWPRILPRYLALLRPG